MRKLIILLLCCGVLISMVGCGVATAPPHTESPQITVSETAITEAPTVTSVAPTEKETVCVENKEQACETPSTAPMITVKSPEEITPSETINTSEKNSTSQTVVTTPSITSQHTESERTVTEPTKGTELEPETTPSEFDIHYWIMFAKEYAVSIGLTLEKAAVDCWDNPIGAGAHCIYLERDIKNRLNRYAKDEDVTDVWIWTEPTGNDCYNIYIGYS